MAYEEGSIGKIAYETQIELIREQVAEQCKAAYESKRLMELNKDTFGEEKVETACARWQALEDCLDALSGASKR